MRTIFVLATSVLFFLFINTSAQVYLEDFKLQQDSYLFHNEDGYGKDVDIYGDYAVVGAFAHDSNSGCVYVLQKKNDSWEFIAQLTPSKTSADNVGISNAYFGFDVAIHDNLIAVAASFGFANQDAIYIFEKPSTGWADATETAVIFPPETFSRANWTSLDVSTDFIAVAENGRYSSGQIYIYEKPESGWKNMDPTAILMPSDIADEDFFGSALKISGNTILTSSYNKEIDGSEAGSLYFFEKPEGGWSNMTETTKFSLPDGNKTSYFGRSVDIIDQKAVATAAKSGNHVLYFFEKNNSEWAKTDELIVQPYNSSETNTTGWNVCLSETTVCVVVKDDYPNCGKVFEKGDSWANSTVSNLLASRYDIGYNGDKSILFDGEDILLGSGRYNGDQGGGLFLYKKTSDEWDSKYFDETINPSYLVERGDVYGKSIAINGDYAAIGTPYYKNFGCVYILHKNGNIWESIAQLLPSDNTLNSGFGSSVCMNDSMVFVGNGTYADHHRIYGYKKPVNGWTNTEESFCLYASDYKTNYSFGASISLDSNILAVSSIPTYSNNASLGKVYLYENPGQVNEDTTENVILTKSDGYYYDLFGSTIKIKNDIIIVGAPYDNTWGVNSGALYVYEKPASGWSDTTETAKLTRNNGREYDNFGKSIAISGNTILVGANDTIVDKKAKGALCIFEKSAQGWVDNTETSKLLNAEENIFYFGKQLASDNDTIYISAMYIDEEGKSGTVFKYIKQNDKWDQAIISTQLSYSGNKDNQFFGEELAINNKHLFVGASGSVYYFQIPLSNLDTTSSVSIKRETEVTKFFEVNIYPNPSSGKITIETQNAIIEQSKLYNTMGQCVMQQTHSENSISLNLNQLDKGIYILELHTENMFIVKKVLKH